MNAKELKAILQALQEHEVNELSLETPDYKLSVKRGPDAPTVHYMTAPPAPVAHAAPSPAAPAPAAPAPAVPAPAVVHSAPTPAAKAEDSSKYAEVKAPIVGTFYSAPSPEAEAFVKEGDVVKKGQVLCIIEAMKLMNEIESEVAGTIKKIMVKNAEPIEYGQVLFLVEPA